MPSSKSLSHLGTLLIDLAQGSRPPLLSSPDSQLPFFIKKPRSELQLYPLSDILPLLDPPREQIGLKNIQSDQESGNCWVVHHIPGRVRIKILPSGFRMAQDMDMDAMIQQIPGISQIRVNPVARSLVIEYDKNRLPYDLWEKMRQLRHNPRVEMEIRARLQDVCI